ncbi:unnamed protein product, partial [Prorocentrum cordatum]
DNVQQDGAWKPPGRERDARRFPRRKFLNDGAGDPVRLSDVAGNRQKDEKQKGAPGPAAFARAAMPSAPGSMGGNQSTEVARAPEDFKDNFVEAYVFKLTDYFRLLDPQQNFRGRNNR